MDKNKKNMNKEIIKILNSYFFSADDYCYSEWVSIIEEEIGVKISNHELFRIFSAIYNKKQLICWDLSENAINCLNETKPLVANYKFHIAYKIYFFYFWHKDHIRNVIVIAAALSAVFLLSEYIKSEQDKIRSERIYNYNNGKCIKCNSDYIPLSYVNSKDGVYWLCSNSDCRFGTYYKKD